MIDKIILGLLGLWMILYGIFAVTNVSVDYSKDIMGGIAIALAIFCAVKIFK